MKDETLSALIVVVMLLVAAVAIGFTCSKIADCERSACPGEQKPALVMGNCICTTAAKGPR